MAMPWLDWDTLTFVARHSEKGAAWKHWPFGSVIHLQKVQPTWFNEAQHVPDYVQLVV
jgi:hypothetical protein